MKTCMCALPALTGGIECCKNCGANTLNNMTYSEPFKEFDIIHFDNSKFTEKEWKDKFKKLKDQIDELINKQQDLDPEFKETVDKYFWELI